VEVSNESVPSEYIRQLAFARPALEDQLADIYAVLSAVSEGRELHGQAPLESARAAYVAYLQRRHLTFNQLVANIAAVSACVFLQESVV
jgi:hypothetical protein